MAGGGGGSSTLELYARLNTELVSMVEHFSNLVKATREGLDADEGSRTDGGLGVAARERRVPGELLEVMAEKLLTAGHQCVHTVSQLKRGAMVSDCDAAIANVQALAHALQADTYHCHRGLDHIRREAEGLLARLEDHYYASSHKGGSGDADGDAAPAAAAAPAGAAGHVASLAELCSQALQMTDAPRGG